MRTARPLLMLAFGLVIAVAGSTISFAQKVSSDPRPLIGDPPQFPVYTSIKDFIRANHGSSLRSQATVVDKGRWVPVDASVVQGIPAFVSGSLKQQPKLHLERAENGTVRWMSAASLGRMPDKHGSSVQATASALSVLNTYRKELLLEDVGRDMQMIDVQTDDLGYRHVRFQQVYFGLPVWGSDLYVHFDATGNAYAINGRYQPAPAGAPIATTLSNGDAVEIAINDLKARGRWAPVSDEAAAKLHMASPTSAMVIYPGGKGVTRQLAYDVHVSANLLESYEYIISCDGGGVLLRLSDYCNIAGHESPALPETYTWSKSPSQAEQPSPDALAGFTSATATDLNNAQQTIRTYQHTDGQFYMIWDLPNLNMAKSQLPGNLFGGSEILSANNKDLDQNTSLFYVTSASNSWADKSSVSAAANGKMAYDYFKNTHSRNAIDGNDESMLSVIHVTQGNQGMDNAYWNGRAMIYGDGNVSFKALAGGLDVAGHEMTHGVTGHSAALVYQDQPGALNESMSDVFAVMIDAGDLTIGEDVMKSGQGPALRDMLNPDNSALKQPQPAHMNQYNPTTQDNGGVHINSGIPNRAAALIIQAIGRSKTERIYYRALTKYLTRSSQFIDARNAVEQSAKDLFGDATEAAAVRTSFTAVGIGSGGGSSQDGDDVPPQTGGKELIAFSTNDGHIGMYDIAANTFAMNSSNAAFARVTTVGNTIERAQLSVTANGSSLYFVNQSGHLCIIDVATGTVSTFNNLRLTQDGDVYNASISPDDNYVALVSSYVDDPNLYIFDGTQIGTIPLKPETSQDNIQDNTIQYPDVVAWSPNMAQPLISFDALRAIDIGTGRVTFWSMYEINFAKGTIFDLVAAQSSDVSVGNVTYSTINPDIIAYNYIDPAGLFDVIVTNFETGVETPFQLPTFAVNGDQIRDAQRPTFSPNGKRLCFTSPELNVLLFANPDGSDLRFTTFPMALQNPVWFTLGGAVGVNDEAGATSLTASVRAIPNPASDWVEITFTIPESAHTRLDVIDVLGKVIATPTDGTFTSGRHTVSVNTRSFTPGYYVIRLSSGSTLKSTTLTIAR